jgi:hypothetical protein
MRLEIREDILQAFYGNIENAEQFSMDVRVALNDLALKGPMTEATLYLVRSALMSLWTRCYHRGEVKSMLELSDFKVWYDVQNHSLEFDIHMTEERQVESINITIDKEQTDERQ